jgi:hypothetical protein
VGEKHKNYAFLKVGKNTGIWNSFSLFLLRLRAVTRENEKRLPVERQP